MQLQFCLPEGVFFVIKPDIPSSRQMDFIFSMLYITS